MNKDRISTQYKESKEGVKELKKIRGKAEISYTGHSLGGGLAETNSITTGDKAITFNAAGVSFFTASGKSNVSAFIMSTDPLNFIQQGSIIPTEGGRKQFVAPRTLCGWYNGHSINSMIDSLKIIKDGGDYKMIEVLSKKWSDLLND